MGDAMLSFLRRKPTTTSSPGAKIEGFILPESSDSLLGTPRRRSLLENIWQRTSLSRKQFGALYLTPLQRYASLVQQLPASENHHHAYPGGMLDHGLEIVAYALKVRQTYLLPIGAPPESQAAQAEAWSAAAAYGALMHDLGKIAVDVSVELQDGKAWHPWYGPLTQPYRFRYVKGRDYRLHGAASSLLYAQVLPNEALDWLSAFPELWAQLIYTLAGQYEHAGILGEIVTQADQSSVAQELGGNPERAMSAPKQSLQRQLVDALRMLVKEKFKLNQPDGPSDGWLTQDALWLVSKPTTDQLRAALLTQGIEGIPNSNAPMFNMLQDQAIIQTNVQDKAIWSVTIDNGQGWVKTFTVLKVAPALVWPQADQRPPSYSGTLTVDAAPAEDNAATDQGADTQNSGLDTSPNSIMLSKSSTPTQNALPSTQKTTQSDTDHMDDLLSLFEDIPQGKITVSTSTEEDVSVLPVATQKPNKLRQPKPQPASETDLNAPLPAEQEDHGTEFISWLREGVLSHKLVINDAKARVHTVDGTAFLVSPDIFKRYALEHPDIQKAAKTKELEPWQLVQRAFEKLKLHRKTSANLNIFTCEVKGPRKSKELRGYLLKSPTTVFNEVPYDNAIVKLVGADAKDATE
ncbi:TraI domain-containing protein [Pseudomonas cichorii]|uniref:MobH family relaxase n=1 Tax=Pseudomonas cichorii TaxID=36746 RepID=UPI0018E62C4B|nr:MobH family relaxase [Pseudomonas cichorii]MBI6855940.1 TraI domain-containing protein [Pseudomonas cichorii]